MVLFIEILRYNTNTMKKEKPLGAAALTRQTFVNAKSKLMLSDIQKETGLKRSEVSMALSYLMKNRYLTRELAPATSIFGRKQVWLYEYHPDRVGA